jgi:signal transduction histidine kinase
MKERAELLGARFKIESDPGKGTTVTVVLPVADSASVS